MTTETLTKSLANSFAWTKYFNRRDYAAAFQNYCAQFSAAYAEVITKADIADLAEALLVYMEERRAKLLPWLRKAAKADNKMLLLTFVTPMLLALGDEGRVLAEALRSAWQDLYDETYEIAGYETIADGFNNSVMGFSLFGGK